MTFPCCKILVSDTDDELIATLTEDILECYTNDVCTSGVGSFKFVLPAVKAFSNVYTTIGDNFKVKIYYGYSGSYTHVFSGKILNHTTVHRGDSATRVFSGKGLGEVLERKIKSNTQWHLVDAHDIVAELATDLGLSTDLAADTNEITVTVDSQTYFDVLKQVSDYWVDSGTQIKKDFGVNKDGALYWKARPLRTSGVETLTNLLSYDLTSDILPSKNYITVYGNACKFLPDTPDAYTETTTGWTATYGSLSQNATHQVGSYSIMVNQASSGSLDMHYTLPNRVTVQDTTDIFFHYKASTLGNLYVELYAPDVSNRFYAVLTADGSWKTFDKKIGPKYRVNSGNDGADAVWYEGAGHPNWWNITAIAISASNSIAPCDASIDGFYFYPVRPKSLVTNPTNIAVYGQRELEVTCENLYTDAECESYAETLLYQNKDKQLRFDPTILGNINVLVGDRLSITLPVDGVSAVAFDVVSVEQHYVKGAGFNTMPHLVNSSSSRVLSPRTPLEALHQQAVRNRALSTDYYKKIVR